jgi:predicted nucleic acid-binding protein
VKLFLDTSVLLAASGSASGASRFVFEQATAQGWRLVSSPWCVVETKRNLPKLPGPASAAWRAKLRPKLSVVRDAVSLDRPFVFAKTKDRPIVLTALAASCDFLLTLDETDFHGLLGRQVYGLKIRSPGGFLLELRDAGRL